MADAPWRCSQCGTINEPAANSCRTCGRWPSLFDLQSGAIGAEEEQELEEDYRVDAPAPEEAPAPVELGEAPAPAPAEVGELPEEEPVEEEPEVGRRRSSRQLARLIIPLLVLLYVLVRTFTNN